MSAFMHSAVSFGTPDMLRPDAGSSIGPIALDNAIRTRDPNKGEVSGFATGLVKPIDLEVSQAGELYYLANRTGSVSKIRYASTP
jgi:hypothetical protein